MTRRPSKTETRTRVIDVALGDRKEDRLEAIKAVLDERLPLEVVTLNLAAVKRWAHDVNQPDGKVHGFIITERKGN